MQERQSLGDILIKFNEQDRFARLRIELEKIASGLKMKLAFCLIQQETIDVFDRRRLKIKKLDRGLHLVFLGKCRRDRVALDQLPELLPNQLALLHKARILG